MSLCEKFKKPKIRSTNISVVCFVCFFSSVEQIYLKMQADLNSINISFYNSKKNKKCVFSDYCFIRKGGLLKLSLGDDIDLDLHPETQTELHQLVIHCSKTV